MEREQEPLEYLWVKFHGLPPMFILLNILYGIMNNLSIEKFRNLNNLFTIINIIYTIKDVGINFGVKIVGISYRPLWKLLIDKGLNKTEFRILVKISPATLAKLSKNQTIDGSTIERICAAFQCQPGDVFEYVPEKDK